MGIRTVVICSMCGEQLAWYGCNGKKTIERWARTHGWSMGKMELCHRCRKPRKTNGIKINNTEGVSND